MSVQEHREQVRWLPALLVVATGLVACQDDGDRAVAPPEQSSEVTSSPPTTGPPSPPPGADFPATVQRGPEPVAVDPTRLGTGAPPRVPYVAADGARQVVVLPGSGPVATLEVTPQGNEGYRHLAFAPYAGGWLTEFDSLGPSAVLVGPDGGMGRDLGPAGGNLFSRSDREEVVLTYIPWQAVALRPVLATIGPTGLRRLGPASSTAGFLGDHEVVATTSGGVVRVDTRDSTRRPVPGISSATMVSSQRGWLIGEAHREHGVYDARTGAPVLGSPTYELRCFNPSGEVVVGLRRTMRTVTMVFVDVDSGRVLRAFRWPSPSVPDQLVWEDDRTLLADFVRFSTDGDVERPELMGEQATATVPALLPPPVT